ncbi:MAG: FtsX-like permease family protein [Clostridia bacterium]
MNTLLFVSVQTLFRRKMTSLLIIIAIVCAVTLTSIGCFMYSTVQGVLVKQIESIFAYHFTIANPSDDVVNAVKNDPRVQIAGNTTGYGTCVTTDPTTQCLVYENDETVDPLYGLALLMGTFPESANEVVMDLSALMALTGSSDPQEALGKRVTLTINEYQSDSIHTSGPLLVTGIYKNATLRVMQNQGVVVLGSGGIDALNASFDRSSSKLLACRLKSMDDIDAVLDGLNISKADVVKNEPLIAAQRNLGSQNRLLILILAIIAVLLFISSVVIYNIFEISVKTRLSQWAIMRAVGATKHNILRLALSEGLILCVVAIPVGWILSYLLSRAIVPYALMAIDPVGAFTSLGDQASIVANLQLHPVALLISGGCAILVTLLSTISAARRASKTSPLEAMRIDHHRAQKKKSRSSDFKHIAIKLAADSVKRHRKQAWLSIATLTIVICLTTLISLLFTTNDVYANLENQIKGDYQIFLSERNYVNNDIPEVILQRIEQLPGITEVYTERMDWYYEQDIGIRTSREFLTGEIAARSPADERLSAIGSAIFSLEVPDASSSEWDTTLARIPSVGDLLQVGTGEIQIVAVDLIPVDDAYYAAENYESNIFISDDTFVARYPDIHAYSNVYLDVEEHATEALDRELRNIVDPYRGVCYIMSQHDVAQRIRLEYSRLFVLYYGFIAILAFVALLSIMNSIYTGFVQRQPEFGVLCALGTSRKTIRNALMVESLIYAMLSAVCSIPIILLIKQVLVGASNMLALASAFLISAIAVASVCLVSCCPAIHKLKRFSIIEAIEMIE